jgi:ribosomal-protein-alanine N-acetyltransferase
MNAPVDLSKITFETERLLLRAPQEQDLEDFFCYASVPGVGEMAGWNHHRDCNESAQILAMMIKEKKTLALILKAENRMIGTIGSEMHKDELGPKFEPLLGREIGYAMSRTYWGQGLMPEAVTRVIHHFFGTLKWDYLVCKYLENNRQSARVAEKCGFKVYKDTILQDRNGMDHPGILTVLLNPERVKADLSEFLNSDK